MSDGLRRTKSFTRHRSHSPETATHRRGVLKSCFTVVTTLLTALPAAAHQPVMDMAPRWENGYGIQTRLERDAGQDRTWIEGVYTFKPELRFTLKVPFADGDAGDAILAMPIKRYRNDGAFTSNWGVTPVVKAPTGDGNAWHGGLSVSYSAESRRWYQLYDLYTLDDKTGVDINVGAVHASGQGSSWFTLWDVSATDTRSGERVLTGPVLMYFKGNIVWRAEYKFEVVDNDTRNSGDYFSLGIGIVY